MQLQRRQPGQASLRGPSLLEMLRGQEGSQRAGTTRARGPRRPEGQGDQTARQTGRPDVAQTPRGPPVTLGTGLGEAGRPVRRVEDRLNALHPRKGGACSTRRNMVAPFIPRDEDGAGGNQFREEGSAGGGGSSSSEGWNHGRTTRAAPQVQEQPPSVNAPCQGSQRMAGREHRQTQRKHLPQHRRRKTRCFPLRTTQSPGVGLPVAKTS